MSLVDALAVRPAFFLSPEPELATPTPREVAWVTVTGEAHPMRARLANATVCAGWIVSAVNRSPYGDPDYAIVFAFERAGAIETGAARADYDLMHWDLGQPLSYRWFKRNMRAGTPVTAVVFDDGAARVYGLLDPYLREGDQIVWAARDGATAQR